MQVTAETLLEISRSYCSQQRSNSLRLRRGQTENMWNSCRLYFKKTVRIPNVQLRGAARTLIAGESLDEREGQQEQTDTRQSTGRLENLEEPR